MSIETMTTPTAPPEGRTGYRARWRTVPRELVYLFIAFPISLVGFGVTISLFSAGAGTIFTFFLGVVFFIASLYVARGFGSLDLRLLEFAGRPAIERPEWQDARARTGFFGWVRSLLGNGHYWLYLLYVMVINFVLATITWSVMVSVVASALGGITYWFWDLFISPGDQDFSPVLWLFDRLGIAVTTVDGRIAESIVFVVVGLLLLGLLPFISRGLVTLHWAVARGVLGAWKSDALQRQVIGLTSSRTAAVAAEGTALRRLERDIHDGPQQRLVRLQMDLAAADRQLDTDPAAARALIAEATQQSRDALEEMRALSRGFAPPILMDRGLVAALESLAVRAALPTTVTADLPDGLELSPELERNAYFIAAEALTNAAKHSGATTVGVRVALSGPLGAQALDVVVSDSGVGGAVTVAGHGLAGLAERVHGLSGTLDVSSPAGGPTVITARLPL